MCTKSRLMHIAFACFLLFAGQACQTVLAEQSDGRRLTLLAADYPPYEIANPKEGLHGFDYEVVSEALTRQGWQVNIVFLPWKRAVSELKSGNGAGLISCAYRPQREEFALYSDQISSNTLGVFYREGFPARQVATTKDLVGANVGAVEGYATLAGLRDAGATPAPVPDDEAGIRMLEVGRIDYFYNGRQATDYLIKQLGLAGSFEFSKISDTPLYLCLSRSFPAAERLLADFNRGLAVMKADGAYALIHARYQ